MITSCFTQLLPGWWSILSIRVCVSLPSITQAHWSPHSHWLHCVTTGYLSLTSWCQRINIGVQDARCSPDGEREKEQQAGISPHKSPPERRSWEMQQRNVDCRQTENGAGGGGVGHGLVTPYKIIRLRQVSKELNTPPWIGLGYSEASSPNPSAKELITTSVFSRVHQHQLETKTF